MITSVNVNRHKQNAVKIIGITVAGSKIVNTSARTHMLTNSVMKMLVKWFNLPHDTEWSCQFRPDAYYKFMTYLMDNNELELYKTVRDLAGICVELIAPHMVQE